MKVGIVLNQNAGKKIIDNSLINNFLEFFRGSSFFCLDRSLVHIRKIIPDVFSVETDIQHFPYNDSVLSGFCINSVDIFIVFGGDGTISDVIFGQNLNNKKIPIFGIGTGSANTGPFINIKKENDFKFYNPNKLLFENVNSLDVLDEKEKLIRSAFIDVVFSDCNISTLNGKIVLVSSDHYLKNEYIEKNPESIWTKESNIKINKKDIKFPFSPMQIIASTIRNKEFFNEKAVFGISSWLPYSEKKALLTVSDKIIIKMTKPEDLESASGIITKQFLFGEGDSIEIATNKGYVIIDGNPLKKMNTVYSKVLLKYNDTSAVRIKRNY